MSTESGSSGLRRGASRHHGNQRFPYDPEVSALTLDEGGRHKPDLSHPAPSVEGILRIYNDARIWVNISESRGISAGSAINSDELVKQLQQEGYAEFEAKNIIDAYAEKGVLEHNFTVRPTEPFRRN